MSNASGRVGKAQLASGGIALAISLLVSGCASPGAPTLRTDADSNGPLIPKCQNVSPTARVEQYNTQNYLTTWGSAFLEGATQGLGEGLAGGGPFAETVRKVALHPAKADAATLFNNLPAFVQPFCRTYDAGFASVSGIVQKILPSLGNPILTSNPQIGVFITGDVGRENPGARWRDFYVISVTPLGTQTEVKILRAVYISRDGTTYNQGVSVGLNETWIFTQIADRLMRAPASSPPTAGPPKPPRRPHRRHK